ncbi:3-deoxy-7-phosphoheptulonate synthase [Candidatus Hakubella thermalkaliphila]|uniref:3-deoxy-7-phosphoheptulonate synthase n=1 Tax=Candidatus Hakubella thermalkaliphila TaxID=2754717 RepID=A0A6V8NMR7_9ACTN|nr:3-deoxy-7-phosphoheptulonate synthase [Candidatus Hakubella thermalkaliphila]GFP21555.1 3-deoxy-7-phosphoheptulonate synthase [Candidatus Hakubella thermalkaliphila]
MIITMKKGVTEEQIRNVVQKLEQIGARGHVSVGEFRTVIGAIGDDAKIAQLPLEAFPGVESVMPILKPYKLVSREFREEDTILNIDDVEISPRTFTVIAGPCSVESEEQIVSVARAIKAAGASILRGGAFKPRTSPYSFQGLGREGLKLLALARKEVGLPVVTEVLDVRDMELVYEHVDILQIGARNMQNFLLLSEAGKQDKPILLKRGFSATIEEFLMAAEYVAKEGNSKIILCERGIRTFETATRNTLDISAIPLIKKASHLPIIVDPCHATGKHDLVVPLSRAAVSVGADGIMVEVHPSPQEALSDGPQSLTPSEFETLMSEIRPLVELCGRTQRQRRI